MRPSSASHTALPVVTVASADTLLMTVRRDDETCLRVRRTARSAQGLETSDAVHDIVDMVSTMKLPVGRAVPVDSDIRRDVARVSSISMSA